MTLTLMPSPITAVIAGRPARVAGILISRLGRSTIFHRSCGLRDRGVGRRGPGRARPRSRPGRRRRWWRRRGGQHVAGVADVVGGQRLDRVLDRAVPGGELGDLVVVRVALGQGRGEDRRVGGHSHHRRVRDQLGQVAAVQPLAGEVVQPDGDARVREGLQSFTHDRSSIRSVMACCGLGGGGSADGDAGFDSRSAATWGRWRPPRWSGASVARGGCDALSGGRGDRVAGEAELGEQRAGGARWRRSG